MKLKTVLLPGNFRLQSYFSLLRITNQKFRKILRLSATRATAHLQYKLSPKKLFLLLPVFFFLSCSTSNDEEVLPPDNQQDRLKELEEAIVGKWDVDNPEVGLNAETRQSTTDCLIFSFIFNADGTFIINHQDGVLTGNYSVTGENSVSLGNGGSLGYIEFGGTRLFFRFEFPGLCERTIQTTWDPDFLEDDCYSFFNCNNNTWWKAFDGEDLTILNFRNRIYEPYFQRYDYNSSLNCKEVTYNGDETTPWVVVSNDVNELKMVREIEGSNRIYTYYITDEGDLYEEIETTEGTTSRIFETAAANEVDYFAQVALCGEKTYVPDDIFEGWLIYFGYDDIMDDYVLTENINTIEQLYISDYNNSSTGATLQSLQGIEDFTALKNLEVQASNLPEIDLSGNINLERLFLGSPALSSLDLSKNTRLNSLYFEFADVHSLDLSKNTELRAVELQLMPLPKLDISKNTKLEMLTIEGGGFQELIAVENPGLWHLNISNSEIEQIDVALFPNLKDLLLDDNYLTSLDVSNLSSLENLEVQKNKFTALDVSANLQLYHFWASQNPDLDCIQIAQVHFDRMEEDNSRMWWEKDETTTYSLSCE